MVLWREKGKKENTCFMLRGRSHYCLRHHLSNDTSSFVRRRAGCFDMKCYYTQLLSMRVRIQIMWEKNIINFLLSKSYLMAENSDNFSNQIWKKNNKKLHESGWHIVLTQSHNSQSLVYNLNCPLILGLLTLLFI